MIFCERPFIVFLSASGEGDKEEKVENRFAFFSCPLPLWERTQRRGDKDLLPPF